MKTRVPKSYREMPGQRIGADLHAFSSESFAPSGRLQLAISCIFRQFVAPKFQTSGYRHRFATPDPPKAVARIRYQLQKRPPFGVAARLPCVDRLMDYSSDLRRKPGGLGYNPLCLCGCSSMVELQPSKLITRVRFPSPAPEIPRPRHCDGAVFFSGAPSRNRTYNLRIRSPLLYPLSHGRLTFAGSPGSKPL